MKTAASIYVAGHRGLAGSALVRALERQGHTRIITRSHAELDLRDQAAVSRFFAEEKPEYVFLAAARVGGILANDTYPAEFIRDNLLIQTNVIHEAWHSGVKKLLFLGSSCIYPKLAPQPMREEALLTGPLEPTNEAYAVAKIAGITMCRAYRAQYGFDAIAAMPTNLYGPGDNFHPQDSHVLPGLIRRFHEARLAQSPSVTIWGSGTPLREFLHADDMAEACLFLMQHYSETQHINVGSGEEIAIRDLAALIAEVVGYSGRIECNPDLPDGTPRKLMDSSRLRGLGWKPRIGLKDGLADTYRWYTASQAAS